MDVINSLLSLAPVPYLQPAFSLFQFIWNSVERAQASKEQLKALASSIAYLLQALHLEYPEDRLEDANYSKPLKDLISLLEEISTFTQREASSNFVKLLFTKERRISQIDQYQTRIGTIVSAFQVSALISLQDWQVKNDAATVKDQRMLNDQLGNLLSNQKQLGEVLDVHQNNVAAMMASMQRHIQTNPGGSRENEFFSHGLRYLHTLSGQQVTLENWTITSLEVDFEEEIGSGGFGKVFKGTWNLTPVAIKVIDAGGVQASSVIIRREIELWSTLRHPHILQFLGANILDKRPFIVTPYLQNGNARYYLQDHPDCNRVKILHHISLGLLYLHSKRIVHGDLKGLNVLINDSGRAVLCDFGLSKIKDDISSRSTRPDSAPIFGSRNWMAPELFVGGSLRMPCDVYSFGMTIYEIYTDETPLGNIFFDFVRLIVEQNARPQKPDDSVDLGLSDEIWDLAERCWAKDPAKRPNASQICEKISVLARTSHQTISQLPIKDSHPISPMQDQKKLQSQLKVDRPKNDTSLSINRRKIMSSPIVHSGTYRISSAAGGNDTAGFLELQDDGAKTVSLDESSPEQKWQIVRFPDNKYQIKTFVGSRFLALRPSAINQQLTSVAFESEKYITRWTIEPRHNTYVIGVPDDELVLDITDGNSKVAFKNMNGNISQRWNLDIVLGHFRDAVKEGTTYCLRNRGTDKVIWSNGDRVLHNCEERNIWAHTSLHFVFKNQDDGGVAFGCLWFGGPGSDWVGPDLRESPTPHSFHLIPETPGEKWYFICPDINSQPPKVVQDRPSGTRQRLTINELDLEDKMQMWEFVPHPLSLQ